ncbi:MAG: hypothetical protein HYX27_11255 [Acidobacteria bacterium]|nr:hypothetical protein [Acidobacteriota bacterium]
MKLFPIFLLSVALFADGPSGARLTGKIETLPVGGVIGNWTVAGRTVQVTASTKISTGAGGAAIVGACVDVKGSSSTANAIAATNIDTRPAAKCDNSTPTGSVEIFGAVEQLPASGLVGDWKVAGTTVKVTAQTKIEQEGGPVAIGSCAEVQGTRNADNSLSAAKIEVSSGIGGCRPDDGGGGNERDQIEFRGTVQTAPATGSQIWTISGRKVLVNNSTTVTPFGRNLATGSCVEVQGRLETDNSISASRVQILGSGVCTNGLDRQADVSFFGTITSLPSGGLIGNWNVSGLVVVVSADTRIESENAAPAAGVCVQVRGDFGANNTVTAQRIETKPASFCTAGTGVFKFEGLIQTLPASGITGAWKIGNRNVTADANTVLDTTKGAAAIGSCAAVTGALQADGSVRATRIEVLSTSGACILAGGVVNAGNLSGAGVSVGMIVSIFGQQIGPATTLPLAVINGQVSNRLANTQVLFDGTPATLLFVSNSQINAIVPCNVAGKTSVKVQVESNGAWTNVVTIPVFATYPSLFTMSNSGTGPGAILNANFTLNTAANATARGGVAILFATGEGQTNPACSDGAITSLTGPFPVPVAPVSVEVGGKAAAVVYAGGAPGLVRGLLQVNYTLAADTPVGASIPVTVKIGDRTSQAGVTMAVK